MFRKRPPQDGQTTRDVRRAEQRVSRARGLPRDKGAEVLKGQASDTGISLHAAALAVLASSPTDELLAGPSSPPGERRGP